MPISAKDAGPSVICAVHSNVESGRQVEFTHKIHSHALTLLLSGSGSIRMDQSNIPAARPVLWCAPAGTIGIEKLSGPAESWYVCFNWPALSIRRESASKLLVEWNKQELRVPCLKVPDPGAATRLVEWYERIRSAIARQDMVGALHSGALLAELFCYYADLPAGEEDSMGHRALSRFQNLLHKHACDDRSLEDLAGEAGISADHLRHLFGRRFGMRPLEYRNGLRLSKARDLLVSTDMNVKEAALRSGFTDALYFSRVFRRRFGLTPRDMIRRYRMIQK